MNLALESSNRVPPNDSRNWPRRTSPFEKNKLHNIVTKKLQPYMCLLIILPDRTEISIIDQHEIEPAQSRHGAKEIPKSLFGLRTKRVTIVHRISA